jgi:hypothetical protein
MEALVKAVFVAVVTCGMLIASFYLAYVLVLLLALAVVGGISYAWFNRHELFGMPFFDD